MQLAPDEFLSLVDEDIRNVLKRFVGQKDFFERAKALLGPRRFEEVMKQTEVLKALIEASGSLEAFLRAASAAPLDIFGQEVRREYELNLSFGCPEPLAKAKALVDLLADRLMDKADEFGKLEMEIWAKMVEECSTFAALKKRVEGDAYRIEEI